MGLPVPTPPLCHLLHAHLRQFTLRNTCTFCVSFITHDADETKQGRSKGTREVLKRIDYGGSATLLVTVCVSLSCPTISLTRHSQVLSLLIFLSMRFSEEHPVRDLSRILVQRSKAYLVDLANRLRVTNLRPRLCCPLCLRRTQNRTRTDLGSLPPSGEDTRAGGDQQLPRRDVQLQCHVQLPDVVPNSDAH